MAKEFGFYWENFSQLIEQIQSECVEIQEAWDKKDIDHLQEEVGDLIQAAISLSIFFILIFFFNKNLMLLRTR